MRTSFCVCVCVALCGVGSEGRAAENLLPNGGFEQVRPVSEQEWAPHAAVGWVLAGKAQLPVGWQPGKVRAYHLPGTIEVVEGKDRVKEGRRCLRITTQVRGSLVRATLDGAFPAPKTGVLKWSYWAKGAGGVKRPGTAKVFSQRFYIVLTYATPAGTQTVGLPSHEARGKPVPSEWTRFSGVCRLKHCTGPTVAVMLAAYKRRGYPVPTTIWLDALCFEEAPAVHDVAPSAGIAPPPRLVARADYTLGAHWRLPTLGGREFWHLHASYWVRLCESLKDNYPRLWEITKRGAYFIAQAAIEAPPESFDPNCPFIARGLRWGQGDYLDPWIRKYGRQVPRPTNMDPERTIDGIAQNTLSGWKSKPGLPQWIQLDMGRPVAISGVRSYPAWGGGRKTGCTVKLSTDGKAWKAVGTTQGVNTPAGSMITCDPQQARYVRIEVTEDSLDHAYLIEAEVLAGGKTLEVASVRASTTAEPVLPKHVKTVKQRHQDRLKKHGPRYLGEAVLEWDNDLSYTWLNPQLRAGDTQRMEMLRNVGFAMDRAPAKTREEAVARIGEAFRIMNETYGGHMAAMTSRGIWEHYSVEFGSTVSFSEITNYLNGDPFRFRMAAARGAARQYGKPWICYTVNHRKHPPSNSYGDVSGSLFFRQVILGYMLNCSLYHQESARWLTRHSRSSPMWGVTHFAEPLLRAERFFHEHPDRGVTYTPILLGLDWLHGCQGSPFWCLRNERPDWMIKRLAWMFMPYRAGKGWVEEDNQALGNSTFGDVFDVMVLNPPSDTATLGKLRAYKAILLLGEIRWTEKLEKRTRAYVESGGTLVLAANQLRTMRHGDWTGIGVKGLVAGDPTLHDLTFPVQAEVVSRDAKKRPLVVKHTVGKGLVIVCAVDCMLDKKGRRVVPAARQALQTLHDQCLPVSITGDIQFVVNRNKTSWIVTLINNRGITKDAIGPTITDHTKLAEVHITPRFPVDTVHEWMNQEVAAVVRDNDRVKEVVIIVPPGDVRVVELRERRPGAE